MNPTYMPDNNQYQVPYTQNEGYQPSEYNDDFQPGIPNPYSAQPNYSGQSNIPEALESYAKDPVTGMAVQYGAQVMGQKFGDVHGKFNMYLSFLKYYFDVDTAYVAKKLRIILMPLSNKSWRRVRVQDETTGELAFASPREDVNAPDLYIPLMSYVTLVLLVGFSMGVLSDKFHPEVLGTTASSALICVMLEAVFFKLGFYLIANDYVPPFLDIIAYCSYIFVSVVVNLLVGMVVSSYIYYYYICTLVTSLMVGIFLVRSLRDVLLGPGDIGNKRRQIFLLGIVLAQVFFAWFLGTLADWNSHTEFMAAASRFEMELTDIADDIMLDNQ